MRITNIDFGPIDARHEFLADKGKGIALARVFVNPFGIDISEYESGKKCFIFGIKGSGKSTLLRIIKDRVQKSSECEFLYFSDALKADSDDDRYDGPLSADEIKGKQLNQSFWRSFFLLVIARSLARSNLSASAKRFMKYVHYQSTGQSGTFWSVVSSFPRLRNWAASIGAAVANVKLEGDFERIGDLNLFYDTALSLLRDVHLNRPFYIFLDELEISFSSSAQFSSDVRAAAALIKEVRDLNEFFRASKIPIFVICAIRKEVSQKILGQDAAKIVRDLGYELSWQRPAWHQKTRDYYHPLFEIVLRRIHASEVQGASHATWAQLIDIERRYFAFEENKWSQKSILDLTTYRPRDIPILFSRAKQHDGPRERFSKSTFFQSLRKSYREDLWGDFAEALRTEHSEVEVDLFRKIFFALPNYFRIGDFMEKADDFSADPSISDLLEKISPQMWSGYLKDLYELGAVGWSEIKDDDERMHFHFRGDTDGLQITKSNYIVKPLGLRD